MALMAEYMEYTMYVYTTMHWTELESKLHGHMAEARYLTALARES